MYNYLLFVLIGILLFLLFNNKNKFSIGFPDHSDSSQSGEDVEQIAAAVDLDMMTKDEVDSQRLTPDDWMNPLFPGGGLTMRGIVATTCAATVGLSIGALAYKKYKNVINQHQQIPSSDTIPDPIPDSDVETGGGDL